MPSLQEGGHGGGDSANNVLRGRFIFVLLQGIVA
jgi:hypothetical protein